MISLETQYRSIFYFQIHQITFHPFDIVRDENYQLLNSHFQQLLNPLGEILEKQEDLISKVFQANRIQTVNLKELSHLYKYEVDN